MIEVDAALQAEESRRLLTAAGIRAEAAAAAAGYEALRA
jgi:hypothetical protein